ncbi:MAG: small acid-soluble spore protein Tlp [Clostridiaceae bacterium]|nr:small acid-soluble spore protein Tlp [Clostridiaceae bacterium]
MAKPDDRRDNRRRIERNIINTIHNMELADEMIHKTDDPKMRKALKEKNERREKALEAMRREIKEEAKYADDK